MFKMKSGCIIPENAILQEEYKKDSNTIKANISLENISKILMSFVSMQNEELFLFIEVPTNLNDLKKENKKDSYVDVYYHDGITKEQINNLLNNYGEILINDGLCEFGFGTRSFNDEIMVHKYNIVTIFSNNIDKYDKLFNEFKIKENNNYKCAWDYFTEDNPGTSSAIEIDGNTVYTIIEELMTNGLYLGERKKID